MSYYVRIATRGSGKSDSARRALDYITDGHDARREASYSDPELHYIARMDPGWKADLEGGRVPLVAFGDLAGVTDEALLAERFERSCHSDHDKRTTVGYRSITLTVPKEVSLFAEGHREEAKAAINAAVRAALDRSLSGLQYSAVAAIHTRNEAGEIHYHVHALVGKFARNLATGRMVSLNSPAAGNGRARLRDLKVGWQEGIEKEFRERLQLGIEQKTPRSPVTLTLPDGSRLEPLNRESRRLLEKEIAPTFIETSPTGETITRHFRWSAMDDRIFEIASGARGTAVWNSAAFKESFPEQARYVARYEARVRSLQAIGYLSDQGKITTDFRVHFAAHHGVLTPELQRVRLDLARKLTREKTPRAKVADPVQFWEQLQRYEDLRRRVERLGYSRAEVTAIFTRAEARKPTRENLQLLRAAAESRASRAPQPPPLPQTKTIIRAYVDLQKAKVQRIYLITSGLIQFWKLREKHALAVQLKRVAERDLYLAKERRLAQVGSALRPVIWLVRIAMPKEARRLDQAIVRCARLGRAQHIRKAGREAVNQAYEQWRREHIQKPLAELAKQRADLALPAQQEARKKVEQAQERIPAPPLSEAPSLLARGIAALSTQPGPEAAAATTLRAWTGKEEALVAEVHRHAKDQPSKLSANEFAAAINASRVGRVLAEADRAKPIRIPSAFAEQRADLERLSARFRALGLRDPFTMGDLGEFSPHQIRAHVQAARETGLLEDGPGWAFKEAAARSFSREVERRMGGGLVDRLIAGRGSRW